MCNKTKERSSSRQRKKKESKSRHGTSLKVQRRSLLLMVGIHLNSISREKWSVAYPSYKLIHVSSSELWTVTVSFAQKEKKKQKRFHWPQR